MRHPAHRLAFAGLALLALGAPAQAEDPAATYDLHAWRTTWTAGASRTVTARAEMRGTVSATSIDQADFEPQTFEQNLLEIEDYTYVQRCEAADEQGNPASFRVFLSAWSAQDQDEGPDESLTGVHLEITVKDGAWSWKALNAPAEPTRLAREWLDKRFGNKHEGDDGLDLAKLGRPTAAVKVGEAWAGNLKFLDDEMPVVPEKSKVELKLESVSEGKARVPVTVRLQLQGFPLGDGPDAKLVPWTEGGSLEGSGEAVVSLAPGGLDGQNSFSGSMAGKAAAEALTVTLNVKMQGKVSTRAGGTIPEMTPVDPKFGTQPVR